MSKKIRTDNHVLEKLVRWGLYIAAFMPLIVFRDFLSPFHFTKVLIFRPWIELLFVGYLLLALQDRRYIPRYNKILWAIIIFVGVFLLTSLTGVNLYTSIMGNLERMGGWFSLVHFLLFFIMMVGIMRTKEHWIRFLSLAAVASGISALHGFMQRLDASRVLVTFGENALTISDLIVAAGDRLRIFGTIGNPALFAGYLILGAFIALYLAFTYHKTWQKTLFGGIFVVNMIAIFMTAVRGSLLASVIGIGIFAILALWTVESKKLRTAFIGLFVLLLLVEGMLIVNRDASWIQRSSYLRRLANISLETNTVQTRLWAWSSGLDGWNDNAKTVLLGWGPENYNTPFSLHFNPLFFDGTGQENVFDRAHNMFVEALVTMGIIGFTAYIAVFLALLYSLVRVWKQHKEHRIAVAAFGAGLIAYNIHNFFIFDTSANYLMFFITAGFIYFLYEQSSAPSHEVPVQAPVMKDTARYAVAFIAFAAMIMLLFTTTITPWRANKAMTRAFIAVAHNRHDVAVDEYQTALAFDTFDKREYRNRYSQYILSNIGTIQNAELNIRALLEDIIVQQTQNITRTDQDYIPYLYISRAHQLLSQDPDDFHAQQAHVTALRMIEISPTLVRAYYEVANSYLLQNDLPNALATYDAALELNESVGLTWWYKGIAQLRNTNDATAGLASLKEAFRRGFAPPNGQTTLEQIIAAFEQQGDVEGIILAYESLLQLEPNNAQYHAFLAAAYAQQDRLDDALRTTRRAVELDPSFEPEARLFLQSHGLTL